MINTFELNENLKKQKKSILIEILDVCFDLDYEVKKMKKFNILMILKSEMSKVFEYANISKDFDEPEKVKANILELCI